MFSINAADEYGLTAVIGPPQQDPILELITRLALRGPVQVIVGGNRFDAHQLARLVRRHTTDLDQTLARIRQARPFTCHQAIALMAGTQPAAPLVVTDLLTTFYDENISDREAARLVHVALVYLQRLGQRVPVLVTIRPSPQRPILTNLVQAAADRLYTYDTGSESDQPSLF